MSLFEHHRARFEGAQAACRERFCWSPFPELPNKYPDAATAQAKGLAAFRAHLGGGAASPFVLDQPGTVGLLGEEVSPYTQAPLGIQYPQADVDRLFDAAGYAIPAWSAASIETRIGVLMEVVDTIYREHLFEIAQSVMHTAGQSFNMAYAGSGVNALDRAIEALVYAEQAMRSVAPSARWERQFGPSAIALEKTYRLIPRGVAVCFSCASFPTWNAWPSMMASLATGNAVIVKPHPATVLPMAITVRVFRQVLAAAGFDPNLVTLALDSSTEPIGKLLVKHPRTAIVDFTGSVRFGSGWSRTRIRRCVLPRPPAATRWCSIRSTTLTPCCAAWPPPCACSVRRCAPARRISMYPQPVCARRRAWSRWQKWPNGWPRR